MYGSKDWCYNYVLALCFLLEKNFKDKVLPNLVEKTKELYVLLAGQGATKFGKEDKGIVRIVGLL